MDNTKQYKLTNFDNGVQAATPFGVSINIDTAEVISTVTINVPIKDIDTLHDKVVAPEINSGTIQENTSIMKKPQTPPTEEIKVI